jgi:hypothetical protein
VNSYRCPKHPKYRQKDPGKIKIDMMKIMPDAPRSDKTLDLSKSDAWIPSWEACCYILT